MIGRTLSAFIVVAAVAGASSARAQIDPAAAEAFAQMIRIHRELPAVVVICTLKVSLSDQEAAAEGGEVTATFTRIQNGDGMIEIGGYSIHINGSEVYVVHGTNPEEFFTVTDSGDMHSTLVWECFGSYERIPFPYLAVLWGVDDPADQYMQFCANTPEHVPSAARDREIDGLTVRTIDFSGPEGRMEINLDPATHFIHSLVHTIDGGMLAPEGAVRTNTYTFTYDVPENFDAASIAFAPAERIRNDRMAMLDRTEPAEGAIPMDAGGNALIGKPAPEFLLQSISGEMIDLAALRGHVVIVDFWATWCPPCRVGLPELHKVAAWAEERGLMVKILTINIADEAGDTPEAKKEAATAFWNEEGFTLPILLDYEGEAQFAYGVGGIPATFIIDPDGFVATVHQGIDMENPASFGEALRREIVRLLEH